MTGETGGAGLHMHTVASDGTVSVADRVEQASERGLDAIAITDHDCIAPELSKPSEASDGVECISGTEVRADVFDTKVELLGYYVDPDSSALGDVLEQARIYRRERNRAIVTKLRDVSPFDRDYEELRTEVAGNLGRPHVAQALVEADIVPSIGAAFDEYLALDGDAYVPMQRVPHADVIDAIHRAGGVASLAHPGRIRSNRVPEMVEALAEAGLDAIEVEYPYESAVSTENSDVGVAKASRLAELCDLVAIGGSDCHGPESGKFRIGDVRVPTTRVVELESIARVRQRKDQTSES